MLAQVLTAATIPYSISLNTAPLAGHPAGPFSLNFQLNDGSGTGGANNTAVLSGFLFGLGGGPAGSPILAGGATGSLGTSVTLRDSSFVNSFTQPFVPGNRLSFLAMITNNTDVGPNPDEFSFAILDRTGTELPTTSRFFDAFFTINNTSPNQTIGAFSSDPTRLPQAGGGPIRTGAAQVQAIPEPGTIRLLSAGLLLLATWARRYSGLYQRSCCEPQSRL